MLVRPIYGFHGCGRQEAEKLIASSDLKLSGNAFEWLGKGFYLWENDPARALDWAEKRKKPGPTVVAAIIDPNKCLDLSSRDGAELLRISHALLATAHKKAGIPLPKNERGGAQDNIEAKRKLDCAVLNMLFATYPEEIPAVKSPFFEGKPVYDGGFFYEKTHVQICVRSTECLLGMFIVKDVRQWEDVMRPHILS